MAAYWIFEYDSLAQVTSGKRYWPDGTLVPGQQFEYTFDTIGNRTGTKAGGDKGAARGRLTGRTLKVGIVVTCVAAVGVT